MMKLMARTSEKSYLNNYKGENWAPVTECRRWFPSGNRLCVRFPSGFVCKVDRCELAYVLDKEG